MGKWTEQETEALKTLYPIGGYVLVREKINRSELSIRHKARRMRIRVSAEGITENLVLAMSKRNISGENNPNWKNGKSKNKMLYKIIQIKRYPQRVHARSLVSSAIQHGKLKRKPCEVCGSTKNVQAHHDDYSKPYDVRWLCKKHHDELHKNKGGGMYNGVIAALILSIAAQVGVPPYFALAIALEENWSLNPTATHINENGTVDLGVMQLNSRYYGHIDWKDPETNIRTGCEIIKELMGNPALNTFWGVAVCYNCGIYRFLSDEGPPLQSIDYAGRVMYRWIELANGNVKATLDGKRF